MINAWKSAAKKKSDAAQDSAARALARAARVAGGGAAAGNDEIIGDDEYDAESDDDDDEVGVCGDDEGPTGGGVAQSAFDAHFTNLDGVKVTELRARLRAKGNSTSVVAADLPFSTPASGAEKSAEVLMVLRKRLADVLATEEPE